MRLAQVAAAPAGGFALWRGVKEEGPRALPSPPLAESPAPLPSPEKPKPAPAPAAAPAVKEPQEPPRPKKTTPPEKDDFFDVDGLEGFEEF